jgi:predicted metal-dependent HD superfamily phosphohydrolase
MSLITDTIRAELARAYTASDRHYHGLAHIEAMLEMAQAHDAALSDPDAVEAAIWFHDAIYDTRRHDNEEQSAALAAERLAALASQARIGRITSMIRATAGHVLPEFSESDAARDCALFLDMDLAILGASPEAFAEYETAVRREYAWVPQPLWVAGRMKVLESFLDRPAIYMSPQFQASHEAAARRNLAQSLARLASEVEGGSPSDSKPPTDAGELT